MCTVSFLPNTRGFYLAMNRDERLDRFAALPPTIVDLTERRAIFPREPDGGTWISVNDAGICFALINWHRIACEPSRSDVSRGEVVKALAAKSSAEAIANGLAALPLRRLRPFRLIAINSSEKKITESRWNGKQLSTRQHAWERRHWFSSGVDERKAELERSRVCDSTKERRSVASLSWLRRLHQSHSPKRGPFSICMHRSDAATVSYTEIAVSARRMTVRYKPGPCCVKGSTVTRTISLAR